MILTPVLYNVRRAWGKCYNWDMRISARNTSCSRKITKHFGVIVGISVLTNLPIIVVSNVPLTWNFFALILNRMEKVSI